VYAYINPIVAILLGALILNEKLTIFIAAGGAITLAGVYLVNNSINKKIILEAKEAII
jgi:drug/metabolite transporter (DMT)-like permease